MAGEKASLGPGPGASPGGAGGLKISEAGPGAGAVLCFFLCLLGAGAGTSAVGASTGAEGVSASGEGAGGEEASGVGEGGASTGGSTGVCAGASVVGVNSGDGEMAGDVDLGF